MIIFLYGRDSYRLKQNLDKIIAEYRKKNSGIGFSVLDFESNAPTGRKQRIEDLINLARTASFFNEKRLIILKNAFSAGEELAGLIKDWKLAEDKQRILVFAENTDKGELAKRGKKLFGLLSAEPNIVKSFEPLEGKRLENWVREEIESAGGKIEPLALKKLISFTATPTTKNDPPDASNVWRLKQEIDKLINYKLAADYNPSRGKSINIADVESLVGPNATLNIFEVVDTLAGKNRPRAITTIYNHLEYGADPYYIFSMIVYQFRNLLRVKSLAQNAVPYADIVKKTGLHPYVARKTYEQCKQFTFNELKQLFTRLAQLDVSAKSGGIDMAEGLYRFTFSLGE